MLPCFLQLEISAALWQRIRSIPALLPFMGKLSPLALSGGFLLLYARFSPVIMGSKSSALCPVRWADLLLRAALRDCGIMSGSSNVTGCTIVLLSVAFFAGHASSKAVCASALLLVLL